LLETDNSRLDPVFIHLAELSGGVRSAPPLALAKTE